MRERREKRTCRSGWWRFALWGLLPFSPSRAELWMPSLFSDGMVLQAGKPVPVWGEAEPGSRVIVEFAGQKKKAVASASGEWRVDLDPMSASSEPRNLTVSSNSHTPILQHSNIQIGEIWILAGQSNMGWPLESCDGGSEAALRAEYPWLRIFNQWPNQGASDEPARDVKGGQWVVCTPQEAPRLSGVGFFFARKLRQSLPPGTPIALVNTQMGGTYAECWIDRQTLENTPSARPFLAKAEREVEPDDSDPSGFWGENNFRRPAALFNGKVAPIQPFAARGVIWYQGEGNSQKWLAPGYAGTLTALINSWRTGFDDPRLPFLVVQLPRYGAGPGNDWPAIRAAQAEVAKKMLNVELIVTIDCGDEHDIHPRDKQPVGERLAATAAAVVYGRDVAFRGPVATRAEMVDEKVRVHFDFAEGLLLRAHPFFGFEVRGHATPFFPAHAVVEPGGTVMLSHPLGEQPVAVRYAWFNWGEAGLFNGTGLPAGPFEIHIQSECTTGEGGDS